MRHWEELEMSVTDLAGGFGGTAIRGFIAACWDSIRRRDEDKRALRRQAAEDLLSWIPELSTLLVRLETECDRAAWDDATTSAYASVRRVRELTPRGWGHLHHSIFDAVGNGAGGAAWIDVAPSWAGEALSYSPEWSTNAAEYLEYVQGRVQAWRNEYGARKAAQVILLSYQNWLVRTRRYGEDV
jgi:hypothetical protein